MAALMTKDPSHKKLLLECLAVFGGIPLAVAVTKPHGLIYFVLWIIAAMAWRTMKHNGYDFRTDWNYNALNRTNIIPILIRFVPCAIGLVIFTWFMIPDRLFSLPLERPQVWVMVMVFYPVLSVVPQEVIFRSYFLSRYASWLSPRNLRIASAIAFGWVHIVLLNWVAVTFSGIGGYFFAGTYAKTKSLALACFEHALYGCFIFTVGLGYYFYHGQAVH